MVKKMRLGNNLRNLLLKQQQTFSISQTSCNYMGEKYTYNQVTDEEIIQNIEKIRELLPEE